LAAGKAGGQCAKIASAKKYSKKIPLAHYESQKVARDIG
jgi:hypothetical protein